MKRLQTYSCSFRAKTRTTLPIISTSLGYRLMASALIFINPTIRCFSPTDTQRAFDYLALTPRERERVSAVIERLNHRLSNEAPLTS